MICNIGTNNMPKGWIRKTEWNYIVYQTWHNMLTRCYNKKYQEKYPTYKECYVCNRWLLLSNFVEDFKLINGYNENKILNHELCLDKDIKSDGKNKEYSLKNCMFVSASENSKQANKTRNNNYLKDENNPMNRDDVKEKFKGGNNPKSVKVAQYEYNTITKQKGNLIKVWDCIADAEKELGLNNANITACCRKKRKSCGGYAWEYIDKKNRGE